MLAAKLSFRWPQCARTDLKKIIPSANADGIVLMAATLAWDPKRRPLAAQVRRRDVRFDPLGIEVISVYKTSVFQSVSRHVGIIRWKYRPSSRAELDEIGWITRFETDLHRRLANRGRE